MTVERFAYFIDRCRINLEKAAADFAKNGQYQEAAYAQVVAQAHDLLIEQIKKMLDEEEQGGKV